VSFHRTKVHYKRRGTRRTDKQRARRDQLRALWRMEKQNSETPKCLLTTNELHLTEG